MTNNKPNLPEADDTSEDPIELPGTTQSDSATTHEPTQNEPSQLEDPEPTFSGRSAILIGGIIMLGIGLLTAGFVVSGSIDNTQTVAETNTTQDVITTSDSQPELSDSNTSTTPDSSNTSESGNDSTPAEDPPQNDTSDSESSLSFEPSSNDVVVATRDRDDPNTWYIIYLETGVVCETTLDDESSVEDVPDQPKTCDYQPETALELLEKIDYYDDFPDDPRPPTTE